MTTSTIYIRTPCLNNNDSFISNDYQKSLFVQEKHRSHSQFRNAWIIIFRQNSISYVKGPSLTKTQHPLHSHHQCDQPQFSINATSLQGVTTFSWLLFFSFTLLFQVARLHAGGKCLHLALVPPSHTFEF